MNILPFASPTSTLRMAPAAIAAIASFRTKRNFQILGKVIERAERQNAHRISAACHHACYGADRSVAAANDDRVNGPFLQPLQYARCHVSEFVRGDGCNIGNNSAGEKRLLDGFTELFAAFLAGSACGMVEKDANSQRLPGLVGTDWRAIHSEFVPLPQCLKGCFSGDHFEQDRRGPANSRCVRRRARPAERTEVGDCAPTPRLGHALGRRLYNQFSERACGPFGNHLFHFGSDLNADHI